MLTLDHSHANISFGLHCLDFANASTKQMIASTRDLLIFTDKPGTFSVSDADSASQTPVTVSFLDAENSEDDDDTFDGPASKMADGGTRFAVHRRLELLEERMEGLFSKTLEKDLLYARTLELTSAKASAK
jgi:hypothetical protein